MTEILATEATLSTLRVEIKALTVSGKQMTLAVFRQLPEMRALDIWWELREDVVYWGTVRYSIRDEGDLWAVMEKDGRLYRGVLRSWFYGELRACRLDTLNEDVPANLRTAYLEARKQDYPSNEIRPRVDYFTNCYSRWENRIAGAEVREFLRVVGEYASTFELSKARLLELPQLFIAV